MVRENNLSGSVKTKAPSHKSEPPENPGRFMRIMRRNCRMVSVLLAGIELSCPRQRTKLLPQLLPRTGALIRPCQVADFASESLAGFNRNSP